MKDIPVRRSINDYNFTIVLIILTTVLLFSCKKEPGKPAPTPVVDSPTIITITNCNLNGWEKYNNVNTTLGFTSSLYTTVLGKGSLEFYSQSLIARIRSTSYNNTLLSSLTAFSFSSFIQQRSSNGTTGIFVVLQVDRNDDGLTDDHLIFEPRYQTAPYTTGKGPDQGPTIVNTWQTWELINGIWWEGGPPNPNPAMGGKYYTLTDYISMNPTAKIMNQSQANGTGGIRFNLGGLQGYLEPNENDITANLDKITIGVNGKSTIYDFESSIANAGSSKTIYHGYGSNCTTIHGTGAGGVAPYTYAWSAGNISWNTQDISVCPTTTTTYTLTTTDANGCSGTDKVTVFVNDVRCGSKNDQVLLCHNGKDICVAQVEVESYLRRGDHLGGCAISSAARKTTELPAL